MGGVCRLAGCLLLIWEVVAIMVVAGVMCCGFAVWVRFMYCGFVLDLPALIVCYW